MANCMPWLHGQQPRAHDPIFKAMVQGGITLELYDSLYDRFNSRRKSNEYLVKVLRRVVKAMDMTTALKGVCMLTLTLYILEQLKKDPYGSWPNMRDAATLDDAWRDALYDYDAARRRMTMRNLKEHLQQFITSCDSFHK
jgi:hypothetical protein